MNILKELDKYLLKEVYEAEQRPVRALVFGFAGIIFTAVVVAIVSLVIRKPVTPPLP